MAGLVGAVVYFIPLVGLGALGRNEARILLGVMPESSREWLVRRVPGLEGLTAVREAQTVQYALPVQSAQPVQARPAAVGRERSPLTLVRRKGVRNLVRIAAQTLQTRAFSILYTWWLRLQGVRVGEGCVFLGPIEIIGDPRRLTIGDGCFVHRGACLWTHDYDAGHGAIELGRGVAIARRVTLNSYTRIQIGDGSGIGDGSYIQDNDHGTEPDRPFLKQPVRSVPIWIGSDVWVGARSIVLKGVSIGDHAVIGAGSVVVKPVPAGVVAVGSPCRAIKLRGGAPIPRAA
jgi:serine acetyltransferase